MRWWTFIVLLVIAILLVSAGRARGGRSRSSRRSRYTGTRRSSSFRSVFRSSRTRSRSRFRSSSRSTSYRSSFSGNRLSSSSSIRSALLLGTVYGASRYRSRARYIADGTLPEVCYNDIYDMSANDTVSYQGRFFCPTDENMSEDYRYCCGEEGQQNCCTFWDKPGHIVGVVFGIIAGMVALFIAVFCVVKCIRTKKSRNCDYASTVSNASKEQVIYPPVYAPPTYEIACGIPNEKTPFANMDAGNCNPPYPPSNVPYPMDDSLCKKD